MSVRQSPHDLVLVPRVDQEYPPLSGRGYRLLTGLSEDFAELQGLRRIDTDWLRKCASTGAFAPYPILETNTDVASAAERSKPQGKKHPVRYHIEATDSVTRLRAIQLLDAIDTGLTEGRSLSDIFREQDEADQREKRFYKPKLSRSFYKAYRPILERASPLAASRARSRRAFTDVSAEAVGTSTSTFSDAESGPVSPPVTPRRGARSAPQDAFGLHTPQSLGWESRSEAEHDGPDRASPCTEDNRLTPSALPGDGKSAADDPKHREGEVDPASPTSSTVCAQSKSDPNADTALQDASGDHSSVFDLSDAPSPLSLVGLHSPPICS